MIENIGFSTQTVAAPEVVVGGARVTPLAQVVSCRLPFGTFTWSHPTAVEVHERGEVRRIRVPDVTRALQVLFFSIAAAAWLATQILAIRERRRAHD